MCGLRLIKRFYTLRARQKSSEGLPRGEKGRKGSKKEVFGEKRGKNLGREPR